MVAKVSPPCAAGYADPVGGLLARREIGVLTADFGQ